MVSLIRGLCIYSLEEDVRGLLPISERYKIPGIIIFLIYKLQTIYKGNVQEVILVVSLTRMVEMEEEEVEDVEEDQTFALLSKSCPIADCLLFDLLKRFE